MNDSKGAEKLPFLFYYLVIYMQYTKVYRNIDTSILGNFIGKTLKHCHINPSIDVITFGVV